MGERLREIGTGDPVYTFSAAHEPVARVQAGKRVSVRTLDSFGDRITREEQKISEVVSPPRVNPLTGPMVIEGAKAGDALRVVIESIKPTRDFAVTGLVKNFGLLTRTTQTALLHDPLPEHTRIMPIEGDEVVFDDRIRLPMKPFIGTLGVAPELEAISSLVPGQHGGNMDCADVCAGNTVIFPVLVDGAYFCLGDGHATQGDGEISGVAAEMPAEVTLRFEVMKGAAPSWPRIESETHLMATGSARPMEDAMRIAWLELIDWLCADYGFDKLDAYELLGQAGEMRVGNVVDPNYTVVAKVRRELVE